MDPLSALLLTVSISLTSTRNILLKSISAIKFGQREFFKLQAIIFLSGTVILFALDPTAFDDAGPSTLLFGILYGVFLIVAQWCYTAALTTGATSTCATLYSLAFIIPTLSGMVFWSEEVSLPKIIGVLTVIPAIILSGSSGSDKKSGSTNVGFIIAIAAAMLASGGVGIVQKLQRDVPQQLNAVVIIAFILSTVVSVVLSLTVKCTYKIPKRERRAKYALCALIGICYAICNLLNTKLAASLPSIIFYPTVNIGIIMLSMTLGLVFLKEKLNVRKGAIIVLGIASILLITLS